MLLMLSDSRALRLSIAVVSPTCATCPDRFSLKASNQPMADGFAWYLKDSDRTFALRALSVNVNSCRELFRQLRHDGSFLHQYFSSPRIVLIIGRRWCCMA